MAQVICKSKHARLSAQIGGVRFFSSDVGRISEEISAEQAEEFCKTPTYFELHLGDPVEEVKKPQRPRATPIPKTAEGGQAPTPGF